MLFLLDPIASRCTANDSSTRCHIRRGAAKMEWVSQALQLPVVVERGWPISCEFELFEKLDFLRGRIARQRGILQEGLEPGLFVDGWDGFAFHELKLRTRRVNLSRQLVSAGHLDRRRAVRSTCLTPRPQTVSTSVAERYDCSSGESQSSVIWRRRDHASVVVRPGCGDSGVVWVSAHRRRNSLIFRRIVTPSLSGSR